MMTLTYLCNEDDNTVGGILPKPCESTFQQKKRDSWVAEAEGNILIDKEFDVDKIKDIPAPFNITDYLIESLGDVVLNESKYVTDYKTKLKLALATYRWEMTYNIVDSLYPVSYMNGIAIFHTIDARTRLELSASSAIRRSIVFNSGVFDGPGECERKLRRIFKEDPIHLQYLPFEIDRCNGDKKFKRNYTMPILRVEILEIWLQL